MPPTKIAVHARLRPAAERDGRVVDGAITLVRSSEAENELKGTISVPNPQNLAERHVFSADAVYGPDTTQEQLFSSSVKPLLNGVYKGINTTVFAYGVTGSGKTHTMQGGLGNKEQGIIPRVMKSIFRRRDAVKKLELAVSYSYVQILNDEVWDLLPERSDSQPAKQLKICSTGHGDEIVVLDMTKRPAPSVEAFEADYNRASNSRKTAPTALNSTSSRSHAILTVYVETRELDPGKVFESRINLVDLAGSEDNKLIGDDKARMRESKAINQSLTQLGTVVDALNTGSAVVPYRESKLTRMLQETLGGNSLSILLLNLAPGEKYAKHTLRTLQFSTRARQVESNPQARVHEVSRVTSQPGQGLARGPGGLGPPVRANTAGPSRTASTQAGPSRKPAPASSVRPAAVTANSFSRPVTVPSPGTALKAIEPAMQKYVDQQVDAKVAEAIKKMEEAATKKTREEAEQREAEKRSREAELATVKLPTSQEAAALSEKERLNRAKVLVEQGRSMEKEHNWDLAIQFMRSARAYMAHDSKHEKLEKRIAELELVRAGQLPVEALDRKPRSKKEEPATADVSVDPVGGPLKRSKAPRKPLSALAMSTNRQPEHVDAVADKDSGKKGILGAGSDGKAAPAQVNQLDKENIGGGGGATEKKRKTKSSKAEDDAYQPEEEVMFVKKVKRPERRVQPRIPVYVDISD